MNEIDDRLSKVSHGLSSGRSGQHADHSSFSELPSSSDYWRAQPKLESPAIPQRFEITRFAGWREHAKRDDELARAAYATSTAACHALRHVSIQPVEMIHRRG